MFFPAEPETAHEKQLPERSSAGELCLFSRRSFGVLHALRMCSARTHLIFIIGELRQLNFRSQHLQPGSARGSWKVTHESPSLVPRSTGASRLCSYFSFLGREKETNVNDFGFWLDLDTEPAQAWLRG